MNFSKNGTSMKQQQVKSKAKKYATKIGVSFFRTFLVCLIAITVIGTFAGFAIIKGMIDTAPNINDIDVAPQYFATYLYDADGNKTKKLVGAEANRVNVSLNKIPKNVQNAFIAIEDSRFRDHHGVDVKGVIRAAFIGIAKGHLSEGASTLTQQLIKNRVFNCGNESTTSGKIKRKIQEQYLAVQLEKKLKKNEILEYYLNTINLGQNTLGVQAASYRYFDKSVSELTLSEAAVIAGITQNPAGLNPISHPEDNKAKRKIVLTYMKNQNYISDAQYQEALADDVYSRIQLVNEKKSKESETVNSYFVDATIAQVQKDLKEKLGYTDAQAFDKLYRGGLSIYTTQDKNIQKICDNVTSDESLYPDNSVLELSYKLSVVHKDNKSDNYNERKMQKYFREKKHKSNFNLYFTKKENATPYIEEYKKAILKDTDKIIGENISFTIQPQISFVIMDQATGQVKAIVGGRGKKTGNLTLNRATTAKRQPGSTFKIVSTYLPALDSGQMTLASVQDDSEFYYPGTEKKVSNWNGEAYNGLTTLRRGIVQSMNVVTVKTLDQITPQVGYDYLLKLGITTLDTKADKYLPLALGGIKYGVTNLELTAAFAAIANGGIYTEPTFYTKIEDHDGNVLYEKEPTPQQVMYDSTAWLLTSAMEDVVSQGTGTPARFTSINMPEAGKTGTTSNDIDFWFEGYTPYYTAGIWGGFDNNRQQTGNKKYAKIIWKTIMEKIHKSLGRKDFQKPDSIVSAKICTKCGKLAVDGVCDLAQGGSCVAEEYFAKGTEPTEMCDCHVVLNVCKDSGQLAGNSCPNVESKVFLRKTETGQTADTPYVLPENFENTPCQKHNGGIINNITNNISNAWEKMPWNNNNNNNQPSADPNASNQPSTSPSTQPSATVSPSVQPEVTVSPSQNN